MCLCISVITFVSVVCKVCMCLQQLIKSHLGGWLFLVRFLFLLTPLSSYMLETTCTCSMFELHSKFPAVLAMQVSSCFYGQKRARSCCVNHTEPEKWTSGANRNRLEIDSFQTKFCLKTLFFKKKMLKYAYNNLL